MDTHGFRSQIVFARMADEQTRQFNLPLRASRQSEHGAESHLTETDASPEVEQSRMNKR
jgi:hypothetical protein